MNYLIGFLILILVISVLPQLLFIVFVLLVIALILGAIRRRQGPEDFEANSDRSSSVEENKDIIDVEYTVHDIDDE